MKNRFFLCLGLIALGIISRLMPHPPNFTAINAIALAGVGLLGSLRLSLMVVFSAMLLSDLVFGFHNSLFFVYLSYFLISLMGYWTSHRNTALMLVASSFVFFLVTNFGVWLTNPLYPKTGAGLGLCYFAALPFLLNQIVGAFFYYAIILGMSWCWTGKKFLSFPKIE